MDKILPFVLLSAACASGPGLDSSVETETDTGSPIEVPWNDPEAQACLAEATEVSTAIDLLISPDSSLGCEEEVCQLVVETTNPLDDLAYDALAFIAQKDGGKARFIDDDFGPVDADSSEAAELRAAGHYVPEFQNLVLVSFPQDAEDAGYLVYGVDRQDWGCPAISAVWLYEQISTGGQLTGGVAVNSGIPVN